MRPICQIHRLSIIVLLITTLVLAYCIPPVSAVTITDDAGRGVSLNATPMRIVSLAPSNTEILGALGLLDRVVGVTDVCDYPPEVKNLTRIGGYSSLSTEKIAAVRPDLVLASDITPAESVQRLQEIGLTVVVIAPRNINETILDIRLIGNLTGTESRADTLAANLSSRLTAIASVAPAGKRPTVAHVVWDDPIYVSGNDTLQNDVIEHAGGINAFANVSGWGTISLENFLIKNPDIIIVSGGGGMDNGTRDVILDDFMTKPQYASLSAVKNHHVYAMNADVISRAGPRIVDATEQVAEDIRAAGRTDETAHESATPTLTSPGFCTGSAILLLCLIFSFRRGRP